MEITLEIVDKSRFKFFLELISNLSFVKIKSKKTKDLFSEKEEDELLVQLMEKSKKENDLLSKEELYKELNW
ncbi:MAG: hypothetical protein H6604_00165 [Flavobacteriales bacterium]|nr:hypothetical protein [Flavobacteriales bacterium]